MPPSRNPELAERVVATGVGDVVPLADLDDPRVLDRRAVESLNARAEHRLIRRALEAVSVAAGREPEVTLVFGMRLGRPVEQEDFLLFLDVPGGRVEDGQALPGLVRMGREDRVPLVAFQLHG